MLPSSQCEVNHPFGGCKLLEQATDSRKASDFVRFLELGNCDKVSVLCEVSSDKGTKCAHVRCVFGGHEGYIKVDYLSVDYRTLQALEGDDDGPDDEPDDEPEDVLRCPECNDVLDDGSQCLCSA